MGFTALTPPCLAQGLGCITAASQLWGAWVPAQGRVVLHPWVTAQDGSSCCGRSGCSPCSPTPATSSILRSCSNLQERLAASPRVSHRSSRPEYVPAPGCCPGPPCGSQQPLPCHSGPLQHGPAFQLVWAVASCLPKLLSESPWGQVSGLCCLPPPALPRESEAQRGRGTPLSCGAHGQTGPKNRRGF